MAQLLVTTSCEENMLLATVEFVAFPLPPRCNMLSREGSRSHQAPRVRLLTEDEVLNGTRPDYGVQHGAQITFLDENKDVKWLPIAPDGNCFPYSVVTAFRNDPVFQDVQHLFAPFSLPDAAQKLREMCCQYMLENYEKPHCQLQGETFAHWSEQDITLCMHTIFLSVCTHTISHM